MRFYGFQEGKSIVHDGSAGLVGLARNINALTNFKALHLETGNEIHTQVQQQLNFLDESPNAEFVIESSNPLTSDGNFGKGEADFYLSAPKPNLSLTPEEIQKFKPHAFIPYGDNIAKYAGISLLIQYGLSRLKDTGVAIIVVPRGFLSRSGYDRSLRKYLIDNKLLQAVVSFNPNVNRNEPTSTFLVIAKTPREGDVYFYDMSALPHFLGMTDVSKYGFNYTSLPFLSPEFKQELVKNHPELKIDLAEVEKYISQEELRKNDYNLVFRTYKDNKIISFEYDDYLAFYETLANELAVHLASVAKFISNNKLNR